MSSLVHQHKTEAFAVGLSWSVLTTHADNSKNLRTRVRKQASMLSATKHVINEVGTERYLGLYSPSVMDPKQPKRVYSLAMAFMHGLGSNYSDKSAINAMLLMTPSASETHRVLVVIEGGQVVYDRLELATEAIAKAQAYKSAPGITYALFSDSEEVSGVTHITWEQLEGFKVKSAELTSIPANIALLLGLAIGAIAAISYCTYYYTVLVPQQERVKRQVQEAAQNQTPQYLQKLNGELSHVGWNQSDVLKQVEALSKQSAYVKGWVLDRITCNYDQQSCEYKYSRLGGEVAELIAVEADKQHDTLRSSKDIAVFTQAIKPVVKALNRDDLPESAAAAVDLRTRIQRLTNAGAQISTKNPEPWPTVGMDMSKVDKKVIVKQSGFESKAPFVLAKTMFHELPEFLALRSFVVDINASGDKAAALNLTLKGNSYAR